MKLLSTQNEVNSLRFQRQHDDHLIKKNNIDIFCYRHPDKVVGWGCVEQNCQKMLMCSECNRIDANHQQEHKDNIVDFESFLNIISQEIKRINRDDSALYNKNIKLLLENQASYEDQFEKKCKLQIRQFQIEIDDNVGKFIQQLERLKQVVANFFDKQFQQYKSNILYFKAQYQQMNPEETCAQYGESAMIVSKLMMKTPHQCFVFLNNLRKSANMEGQLLNDLDYLSQSILKLMQEATYFIPEFVLSTIKNTVDDAIHACKTVTIDHLKDIPSLDKQVSTHSNAISQSFLSFNRNQIRLYQSELFDSLKNFHFSNVGQIQTHHSNSVSALVALTDEVVATASYDRSIKIWRLNTGELMKTIYDLNCISSLVVLKISNDKNPQNDSYTDDDVTKINTKLLDNRGSKISDSGLLLISGGFDTIVKVWDFNLLEESSSLKSSSLSLAGSQSLLSQPYHLQTFPIKQLQGHNGWITAMISLQDEKNVASGDDTGELIIWDAINGILMYRLPYIRNPCMMPFINLCIPFNSICCSSSTVLRIYNLQYSNTLTQNETNYNVKDRLSRKFLRVKEDPVQIIPQLQNVYLQREIDLGWSIHGCITPYNYKNLVIVFGAIPGKMKYIQLDKGRQIEITGDWNSYIGHLLLIEKFRIRESQMDQFYKNFNFVVCGEKHVGLYDGYGNRLRILESDGLDDFHSSNLLCQRNMQILKMIKKGSQRLLRMAVVSQYSSESYNYKSSRITIFEIKCDFLDFK